MMRLPVKTRITGDSARFTRSFRFSDEKGLLFALGISGSRLSMTVLLESFRQLKNEFFAVDFDFFSLLFVGGR